MEQTTSPACSQSDPTEPSGARVSLYGISVEYGLHCLLWLTTGDVERASSRDLAELQGVPPAMLAKIMPRLEKAGIVTAKDGIASGYSLARPADQITVLDVVHVIEGKRLLFDCKEVRRGCALFGASPPAWSVDRICGIHAAILRAEHRMRAELARTSLIALTQGTSSATDRGTGRHAAPRSRRSARYRSHRSGETGPRKAEHEHKPQAWRRP